MFKKLTSLEKEGLRYSDLSDKELMQMICKGDTEAFREIYNRYIRRVFSMAYRFSRDYEISKDISQEIFLRLYQKKALYKPEISFNTFFYRLTYNCILNYIRDHKGRFETGNIAEYKISSPATPEETASANEMLERIERRIDALPENQKMAFLLNKIEGLSYEEVAQVMDMNINTVKSLIHRASLNILELKDE